MRIIDTSTLTPAALAHLGGTESNHIYNGLDCCVTLEVLEAILPDLDPVTQKTYDFSRALQAPILEMNMHGVLIDQYQLSKLMVAFEKDLTRLQKQFDEICLGVFGRLFSMTSPKQLGELFYDTMKLPEVRKRNAKGQMVRTTNRDALEKLQTQFIAQPLVAHILGHRDLEKKLQFLKTGIDSDSRLRTSFNIAGTVTGRLSSNYSDFGTGTNLQNIERRLRRIIVSDPGYKFCNIDLEQGDSRNLGFLLGVLFNDWTYLNACESGDLHTTVAQLTWPELAWTDDPKANRAIAELPYYRWFSMRDMTKKVGHATNFYGKPYTISVNTKVPQKLVKEFQAKYFARFPAVGYYHTHVSNELRINHSLTTPFGRRRHFYGRVDDDATLREAIAFVPQSMTADEIDEALLRIWNANIAQPLLQVHDSLLFQYPEKDEAIIVPKLLSLARVPLYHGTREFVVPVDAKIGWNWAEVEYNNGTVDNVDGLRKWQGATDTRRRTEEPKTSILDRLVC